MPLRSSVSSAAASPATACARSEAVTTADSAPWDTSQVSRPNWSVEKQSSTPAILSECLLRCFPCWVADGTHSAQQRSNSVQRRSFLGTPAAAAAALAQSSSEIRLDNGYMRATVLPLGGTIPSV